MTLKEFDFIAFAAFIVAAYSLYLSWRTSQKMESNARENTNIQHAMIESSLRQSIEAANSRINDIGQSIIPLNSKRATSTITPEENLTLDGFQKSLDAAIESMLNTVENACSNYLDNKIDKVRFKQNYVVEIRNLVEKPDLKKYFDPNISRYKPILKVYKEWNDHENT